MATNKVKKKNYVQINKNVSEDEDEASDCYDSMISNATSDESDGNDAESHEIFQASESSSGHNESDDGFSDEDPGFDAKQNGKTPSASKRKNEVKVSHPAKKIKSDILPSKNLYKAPTVEEINRLRETETQFHSNLFRMQIEEMLQELKTKNKLRKAINEWLDKFNLFLNELKCQTEKFDSENLSWVKKNPFKSSFHRKNITKQKFQFQFLKPSKPAVLVGSIVTDTIIDSKLVVDICIEMPAKTFQKGDYLNMIYEEKRSLYMLYLAHKMVDSKKYNVELMHYNYYQNNPLKPVLEVNLDGKYQNKVIFRVFPVPEENAFKMNRFVPWNSNIRRSLFGEILSKDEEILYATPYYNSNILFDLTMIKNNELIRTVIGNYKNLQEGLILLKIWLKQRCLSEGSSGFSNHIITLFIVWLVQHRKLHLGMSNYQIARNVWHQLASSSWNEEGLSLCKTNEKELNQPTVEQMHQYFDLVLIDNSGFFNICANMSLDVYLRIKYESSRVVELLNDNKIDSFQQLFMTKLPHYIQFDHIFGFECYEIQKFLNSEQQKADFLNFAGHWIPHAIKIVTKILRKGLNDRIISMTPLETSSRPWSLSHNPENINKIFRIGLVLNPRRGLDVLDKGPQANEPTANEFRNFWGNKSELRRFQDGSITEACVWGTTNETLKEKRLIVKKIVLHLLQHHFQMTKVKYLAEQFDLAYELDNEFSNSKDVKLNAEYYAIDVIKNFDDIGKKLRALQELPLDVTGIQGISPVFRFAEPIPILNHATFYKDAGSGKPLFRAYNINDGIIELGVSGKWPNDLLAFRRIKTAFHIQIANTLNKVYKLKTRAGIDGIHILNEGYLYRIQISHSKEVALLKKSVTLKGVVQYVDTTESIQLEKRLSILPKVTSALHGLYQQFSSYGPTVMIAKRWLNSQLIDIYHWPDECTEFLIAYQFLKHETLPNPCQPQTGFLRFLNLLSNMNWQTDMFILNFNDDMTKEEIAKLEEKFTKERDTFPALFIATSFDEKKYGIWWSNTSPNIHILARVVTLARHALEILKPAFSFNCEMLINNLFIASLDGYDVIIKLNKDLVQKCPAHSFLKIEKQTNCKTVIPTAGFNSISRGLHDLREGYSEFALFFYNPYGGYEIAVKWKPDIFEPKEFSLAQINACNPFEQDKIACRPKRLITDFKIILKGLFDEIVIK